MADEEEFHEEQLPLGGVGEQLRVAREAKGLSVAQVAAETRINAQHLGLIEAGKFAKLPGRTYAVGFSRTYARMVGLDEIEVADLVREELNIANAEDPRGGATFEPGDPARVPSGKLAFAMLFAAVLLMVGGYMFFKPYLAPGADLPALQDEQVALATAGADDADAAADAPAGGAVVFTALEEGVWVKFYDVNGSQLMQKQMALNESYTVPSDAEEPQIWTGRPDALAISIGGKAQPKLADELTTVKDVAVTAQALLARAAETSSAPDQPAVPATGT